MARTRKKSLGTFVVSNRAICRDKELSLGVSEIFVPIASVIFVR